MRTDACCERLLAVPNTVEDDHFLHARSRSSDKANEHTVGKWLIFLGCATVVDAWVRIVAEVERGNLWSARVSCAGHPEHALCVYTRDYQDVKEVRDVGIRLGNLGLASLRPEIYYEPDVFALEGVYQENDGASIYAMRLGSTFLRVTPGISRLPDNEREMVEAAIKVLPRGLSNKGPARGRRYDPDGAYDFGEAQWRSSEEEQRRWYLRELADRDD